jgi:pimeloyl-[acyl-carrier protein] methyl ester esterase
MVEGPGWCQALPAQALDQFCRELEESPGRTLRRFIALQTLGAADKRIAARSLQEALPKNPRAVAAGLRAGLSWLAETDLRPVLGAVRCPVGVWLGGGDTIVPPGVLQDLRRLRPDWPGRVLPAAGHAPFAADPECFARQLLQEVSLAG